MEPKVQTQGAEPKWFHFLHDFMRYGGQPMYYMYKVFLMLHSLILPLAWKLTHIWPAPGALHKAGTWRWEHLARGSGTLCSTQRWHQAAAKRSPEMTRHDAASFLPSISNCNCNTPKSDLMIAKMVLLFIHSPTLLFCTRLEMGVFLDYLERVSPFKGLYIFIMNQN